MRIKKTSRGFRFIDFVDAYESACSLQESSLADVAAIWFGVDRPFSNTVGCVRMHLTQRQVKDLLPVLQFFAKEGRLPKNFKEAERGK